MEIGIDGIDNGSNPIGASLLSGDETIWVDLRELSPEELKTTGGGGSTVISRGIFGGIPIGIPIDGFGGGDLNINVNANANAESRANPLSSFY